MDTHEDGARPGDVARAGPGNTPGRAPHAWRRYLAFTLIIWVTLVLILEIVLRFAGFSPPRAAELAPQYSKFQPDKELIWALKPDWHGFEINDIPLRHNTLGLRGPEPAPGDEIGFRVLFLGDSVTYGQDLQEEHTIPRRLELEMEARLNRPHEVINAGVPGYSTFQEALLLRRYGRSLRPDLILLGFCLNDVTERYTSLASFGGSRYFMMYVDTASDLTVARRLWLSSAIRETLVRLFRSSARRGESYRLRLLWEEPENDLINAAWETAFAEIDQVAIEAHAIGTPLAVILYPHARQVEMASGAEAPQRRLSGYLDSRGIPFLDLLGPMRASPFRMQQLFFDPTHFSPPGAAVAAKEIAEFILAADIDRPPDLPGP